MIEAVSVVFGATAGTHIYAAYGGEVRIGGAYSITGAASQAHIWAEWGGKILYINSPGTYSLPITGTLAFTTFANCDHGGMIHFPTSMVGFTGGTVTGTRYAVAHNSILGVGCVAGTFPGNVAGGVLTGGLYY